MLKRIAVLVGLALLSSHLHADLLVRTETVKGTKPVITSNVGVFNYTNKERAPRVGDDVRHYSIATKDADGDAITILVEWLRDGQPIPGATSNGLSVMTYKPVAADIGKRLSVKISLWTNPSTTDPSEGDTRYSAELEPVEPALR